MTFEIRPLAAADREHWEPLWQGYLTFYEATLSDQVTEVTWQRLMTTNDDPYGLVAVGEDGALVGVVHYLFHRSTWTIGPYCYLQDLFVAEATRGQGIGRALIEAVYDAADKAGASYVYWLTQDFNATARHLYDQVAEVTPFIKYRRP